MKKLKQLFHSIWNQITIRKRLRYYLMMSVVLGWPTGRSHFFAPKKEIDEFFANRERASDKVVDE
jgi:hypothetical protein